MQQVVHLLEIILTHYTLFQASIQIYILSLETTPSRYLHETTTPPHINASILDDPPIQSSPH